MAFLVRALYWLSLVVKGLYRQIIPPEDTAIPELSANEEEEDDDAKSNRTVTEKSSMMDLELDEELYKNLL